jgi:hypothetical protein
LNSLTNNQLPSIFKDDPLLFYPNYLTDEQLRAATTEIKEKEDL